MPLSSGSPHVRAPVRLRAAAPSGPPGPRGAGDLARAADGGGRPFAGGVPYRRTHRRALAYIEGLFSTAPRKNSWQLAEVQGEANPYGFQHLLGRAA